MQLFAELKRRGVVQVGVAYMVTSWLLVQVAGTVFPAFDTPAWVMRALFILLTVGFPITLLISWVFDLTSHGLIRTPDASLDSPANSKRSGFANMITIGILAAAVILFALDKFYWKSDLLPAARPQTEVVAVLPFQNMNNEASNDAFTLGVHEDLLTQLSKIRVFRTLSRTSVSRYVDSKLPIPEIAEELGASVILEGSVQRSEDRVRINTQLVDGDSDGNLWAETYDRQLTAQNIFAIQSEIAKAIAHSLKVTLSEDEQQRLDLVPTKSLEAYDAYTTGLASMEAGGVEDFNRAAMQFNQAIEIDPGFASAWASLCQAQLSRYQKSSDTAHFHAGEAACEQALELDDSRVEIHIALGTLYRYFGQYARAEVALQRAHYAKAEQALEQALSLDGLTVAAMVELGHVMARQNRLIEAEAELLKAEQVDPRDYAVQSALFSFYYVYSDRRDRFEMAAEYGVRMTSMRPDLPASWNNLGTAKFMLNRYNEAADAYRQAAILAEAFLAVNDRNWQALSQLSVFRYFIGEHIESERIINQALEMSGRRAEVLLQAAILKLQAGDEASSLSLLEEAVERDADYRHLIANDPDLKAMESNPRMTALIARKDALFITNHFSPQLTMPGTQPW